MINIKTYARLHLGLIEMNGEFGRRNISLGLSLSNPFWKITIIRNHQRHNSIEWNSIESDRSDEIDNLLNSIKDDFFDTPTFLSIKVSAGIKQHVGLGSTTSLYMGIAKGLNKLSKHKKSLEQLAILVKRAGTSGIGFLSINNKGLLLDSGRSYPNNSERFTSSDFSKNYIPPKLISKFFFPIKKILYVIPKIDGYSGLKEQFQFERICPVSSKETGNFARITISHILSGIAEGNLELIYEGINKMQNCGFKKHEIDSYGGEIREIINALKEHGGKGIGMSSFGPGLYILGGDFLSIREYTQKQHFFSCKELTVFNEEGEI